MTQDYGYEQHPQHPQYPQYQQQPPTLPENLPVPSAPPAALPVPYTDPYGAEVPLATIGDITVTQTSVIVPHGRFPVRGSTWSVQDSTQTTESIPAYAIVLTILFVWFCLLGLLFLLIKQRQVTGFITVTVAGAGFVHTVQLPPGPQSAAWVAGQVHRARSLAAMA